MRPSLITVILIGIVFSGCVRTLTTEYPPLPPNVVGHAGSGIKFPDTLEGFRRVDVQEYDEDGTNVGVGYNLVSPQNQIAVTIYVYPVPPVHSLGSSRAVVDRAMRRQTDSHYQALKSQIIDAHPVARQLEEHEETLEFRGELLYGRVFSYESNEKFAMVIQPVHSHLEIYRYGDWFIKWRISHSAQTRDAAQTRYRVFQQAFISVNAELNI